MTAKLFNTGPFAFTPFDKLPGWYLAALLADHAEGVKWGELDNETKEALQKEAKARAIAGGVPNTDKTVVKEDGSTAPVETVEQAEQTEQAEQEAIDSVSGEPFNVDLDGGDEAAVVHTSPVPELSTPSLPVEGQAGSVPNLDPNPAPADSTESEKDSTPGDSVDETASAEARSTRRKK